MSALLQRASGLVRWASKPLTLSQALASLAGAGAMLLGGWAMDQPEFARFALFNVAYNLLTGLVRAGLYQPALIARRKHPSADVPWRYALVAGVGAGVAMAGSVWALGVRQPIDVALLGGSAMLPAWYDWLYYRGVALDRRWDVVRGNAIRVLLVGAAAAVPPLRSDAVLLQTYLSASLFVGIIYLLHRLPRTGQWLPFRTYGTAAGWQLVDFLLGQSLNSVPMLVLGGAADAGPVSGVRFAQALLGPLNLAAAAASANLVADGATRTEYAAARTVIVRGSRIGRAIGLLALVLVGVLALAVWLTGFRLRGVDNSSLLLGLVLVGASLITTGWANMHGVVLRVLDRQARVTLGRGLIAVLTTAGFAVGFWLDGTTGSLIAGFLTLAVASPAVFLTMSTRAYRSLA